MLQIVAFHSTSIQYQKALKGNIEMGSEICDICDVDLVSLFLTFNFPLLSRRNTSESTTQMLPKTILLILKNLEKTITSEYLI